MTLGFTVGKFYPPHRGHKHLIDSARAQCDRLVVLLPHHRSQKIEGELRKAWLEEIHPDCEIHLVDDTLGDDGKAWALFTLDHLCRAPDVVFTSEDYGESFARYLGCRHVMIDRDRRTVPISGTKIRQSPLDCLEWLEPCVRAYFVKRVVLIGAESTGKTTLAAALAEQLKTTWVPEFGREYWEHRVAELPQSQRITGPWPTWTSDEFVAIAAEQQRREGIAARVANRVLICDTNAFATGTWHERYLDSRSPAVDAIGAADRADLYLLCDPDFPFVQDGWRDGESIRGVMHRRFVEQLTRRRTVRLSGPFEQRLQAAKEAIHGLLAEPIDL